MIKAKSRLLAVTAPSLSEDPVIRQKQKQIDLLRKSLPSKFNKRSVTPEHKIDTRLQINDLQEQILERRKKLQEQKEK